MCCQNEYIGHSIEGVPEIDRVMNELYHLEGLIKTATLKCQRMKDELIKKSMGDWFDDDPCT